LNPNLLIGLFFYGIGTVLFIPALKGGELSVLYPLISTTYIWVSLWSMRMLGEKMNSLKWIGVALIMGGVSLIGLGI
jgi:drug/metabolite transporter (DMT)-like permease